MQEILTLSFSQRANYLSTHFYNSQESYFEYNKPASDLSNDPTVHFRESVQSNNTVNYHPRALIWELNGGFGSLGQFEYFPQDDQFDPLDQGIIKKDPPIRKSEYQKALDSGISPLPLLKSQDIQYWSDFNRVVFEPKSFNVLNDWIHELPPEEEVRLFKGYDVGVEEWNKVGCEFMEEKYRVSLEECDSLNGINIVSDLDSAWGGFTSCMLAEMRDDYNPKSMVFNWALSNGKSLKELSPKEIFNRIKTFIELNRNSNLFIPFANHRPTLWESSALQNIVFETIQTLNSQRSNRTNFHHIEASLVKGTHRTVVTNSLAKIHNSTSISTDDFCDKFFQSLKKDTRETHQFSSIRINRPSQSMVNSTVETSDSPTTTIYKLSTPYATPSSYPQTLLTPDSTTSISLSMESSARRTFLDMKDWISRTIKGDERAELIDELSVLASEYEYGWGDSDTSDDDY